MECAVLAESEGVELYALGLEYLESTTSFPNRWRDIIRAVRNHYGGALTYSANWYREFEEIQFWDELDYIGIGAYFPLGTETQIDEGWARWRRRIEAVSNRYERRVLFTELGYPNLADASERPWDWQKPELRELAPEHQATCYEKMFQHLGGRSWFCGLFVWQYHPDFDRAAPWEYSPRGKPAEKVIESQFRARVFER